MATGKNTVNSTDEKTQTGITIIPKERIGRHEVCSKLTELLNSSEQTNKTFGLAGGLCCGGCGEGEPKVLLYDNPDSEFCFYCPLPAGQAFIVFIKEFFQNSKPGINLAYSLLQIARELSLPEKEYFVLFPLLGWQSSKKGLDYLAVLTKSSEKLRSRVLDKKLAIGEAVLFHTVFKEGYDDFLDILPEKLSFSEQNSCLRNIAEFERKNRTGLAKLGSYLKGLDKEAFLDAVRALRFPLYSACTKRFETFTGALPLPKGTRLVYDPHFEKENYTLEISFSSLEKLQEKLAKLSKGFSSLDKEQVTDYFNHSLLFADLPSEKEALAQLFEEGAKSVKNDENDDK